MKALKRRALLVGINDYTSGLEEATRPNARWRDLGGAVSDAEAMKDLLLRQYGFPADGVLLLTDRAATHQAILDGLEQHLLAPARRGDEVVFFYAGHGSQVPNSASEEADKLDESLVPADSNRGAPDVRDKELARLFNRILDTGSRLTVIFDSCHSGSAARGLPPGAVSRFLPASTRGVVDAAPVGGKPEDRGALILSASQDFELAYETYDEAGQRRGAFSHALLAALGRGLPGENTEATFLRARALLQTRETHQQPVLAGPRERRNLPLFGDEAASGRPGSAVAVQRVETDGRVILQGGWVHGLGEGVELETPDADRREASLRLRVTRILGPTSAEATILHPGPVVRATRRFEPGDLVSISRWVIANEPTLRVWVPEVGPGWTRQLAWVKLLKNQALKGTVSWVTDPIESTPTHVLDWREGGWWLTATGARSEPLGTEPGVKEVLQRLRAEAKDPVIFVHLPAPAELARGLAVGSGTDHDAVERVSDRARANYQLVGRLAGEQVDFAWVRPGVGAQDAVAAQMPLRSSWCGESPKECASELTDKALRLAKIRAWLKLESPPGADFPYQFALRSASGMAKRSGPLYKQEKLGLLLKASPEALARAKAPRYLYFFTVDSFGNSTLLFPRIAQGSVENRYPILAQEGDPWPAEIQVGAREMFRIREPFGMDTYFLLSTEEPIANPWMVQFPGVRSRGPAGKTALEELLSQTGSAARGAEPLGVPVTWSLERLTFETSPATGQGESSRNGPTKSCEGKRPMSIGASRTTTFSFERPAT